MRYLGIIPARAGSTRLRGKNKKDFCGKPLICYIIEESMKSSYLSKLVVSTDDKDILEIATTYDGLTCIRRPERLASATSRAIEYIDHALQTVETVETDGAKFDAVVILQPTSPLTVAADIDSCIQLFEKEKPDSVVTVKKLDHDLSPVKMKLLSDRNQLLPYLENEQGRMASDQLPDVYVRNGSVYVTSVETIKSGDILGDDSRAVIMPAERSVDINEPIDFEFAEFLYKKSR